MRSGARGYPGTSPDLALLWLRIATAAAMFALHGWGRLVSMYQHFVLGQQWAFQAIVQKLGFPLPVAFAVLSSLTEALVPVMLVLGLYTRWAAAILAVNMAVAVWSGVPRGASGMELAILYLIALITILLAGPGRNSLDSRRNLAKRWL
jgi:putative oxidoreductase